MAKNLRLKRKKTRCSPRTRMLTRMLMVQMSKHMDMQSRRTLFCNSLFERCSKLQLKLNGNYSSLREILAPSLRDHNGSLRAVNFSNWACATLREDEFLRFGAFLLARCRHEADFGLGFLGFSDSRLVRWFLSFSTSWLVRWLLDF